MAHISGIRGTRGHKALRKVGSCAALSISDETIPRTQAIDTLQFQHIIAIGIHLLHGTLADYRHGEYFDSRWNDPRRVCPPEPIAFPQNVLVEDLIANKFTQHEVNGTDLASERRVEKVTDNCFDIRYLVLPDEFLCNADGMGDILWRNNTSGQVEVWPTGRSEA